MRRTLEHLAPLSQVKAFTGEDRDDVYYLKTSTHSLSSIHPKEAGRTSSSYTSHFSIGDKIFIYVDPLA